MSKNVVSHFALEAPEVASDFKGMRETVPSKQVRVSSDLEATHLSLAFELQNEGIRRLIWVYVALWLIEGGLRRWLLPGLATPLLLVRDPLVVTIYFLAFSKGIFPFNYFIRFGAILAYLTFANALASGHGNLVVALYGVRCDFLHVPLIFIIARVLRQRDLLALARAAVWLVIPYTALLVAQFYAPQDAWVNRGVGGSLDGAGFSGALGHFRPAGTFSFITGPVALYPLVTACWFALVLTRQIHGWLMIASSVAILVAVPVSVSRVLFLSVTLVVIVGIGALFVGRRLSAQVLMQAALAAILLPMLALQLPAFKDGMEAFVSRWETGTTDQGGFQEAIIDRQLNDLFGAFNDVGLIGLGTGYSTNVGQQLLTQNVGFGAAEAEWGRLLSDNGLILGCLLVGYRIALAGTIVLASLRACQRRCPQAIVFAAAALLPVLAGQWGQATVLGGAAIMGGLALAAASDQNRRILPIPLRTPRMGIEGAT